MRDDLQQLPPLLLTLLTGGRQQRKSPAGHETVPMGFARQEGAQQLQQQQVGPASRSDGRMPPNQPTRKHTDQLDGGPSQWRPTNEVGVNTEPRKRMAREGTQEGENEPPQTEPQAIIEEAAQSAWGLPLTIGLGRLPFSQAQGNGKIVGSPPKDPAAGQTPVAAVLGSTPRKTAVVIV